MSKVFIAKGHGEGDPGAVAAGYTEHDLVAPIAEAMRDTLNAAGVETTLDNGVRDVPAQIREQAALANRLKADLTVQVHLNSFSDPRAHGSEVWIYAPGGRRESWAKKLAAELDTFITSRGVKSGHYTFLGATAMPAVIVEVGFITNDADRDIIERRGRLIGHRLALATLDELGIPRSAASARKPETVPGVIYRVQTGGQQVGAFGKIENALAKVKELLREHKAVRVLKGES